MAVSRVFVIAVLVVLGYLASLVSIAFAGDSNAVFVDLAMNVDGGALTFLQRVFRDAGDRVVILGINSYGGYLSVADEIVNTIVERNITCYAWVPPGGYAVSAASMVALACRGIFMGSGSVIGDAIPQPSDKKTVEYVAARFRSLAQRLFGNNATLVMVAESMVREGKTLTADEAISIGFARRADSLEEVEKAIGVSVSGVFRPGLWDRLVSVFSLPIVSMILLVSGAILVVAEILTAGFQGYAVAGAILISLSLYSMNIIPPDIFALIIAVSGATLLAVEMFTPGFGLFGVSGIALLVIGAAYQIYLTPPQLLTQAVYIVIGGLATISSIMVFAAYKAVETARRRRPSLEQQLLSSIGIAKTDIGETSPGVVYVLGEDWTAYSVRGAIPAGSRVRVVRVDGLKLYVEKID
ncbi:MAG: NfeD family protein [Ignisphaera sp.]